MERSCRGIATSAGRSKWESLESRERITAHTSFSKGPMLASATTKLSSAMDISALIARSQSYYLADGWLLTIASQGGTVAAGAKRTSKRYAKRGPVMVATSPKRERSSTIKVCPQCNSSSRPIRCIVGARDGNIVRCEDKWHEREPSAGKRRRHWKRQIESEVSR